MSSSVLNIVLSHQSPVLVSKMLDYWSDRVPRSNVLIAYGGSKTEFHRIEHAQKFFVDDPRLRTRDHQRELQSYTRLLKSAAAFLKRAAINFNSFISPSTIICRWSRI